MLNGLTIFGLHYWVDWFWGKDFHGAILSLTPLELQWLCGLKSLLSTEKSIKEELQQTIFQFCKRIIHTAFIQIIIRELGWVISNKNE